MDKTAAWHKREMHSDKIQLKRTPWPLIETLVAEGVIPYIDYLWAEKLLNKGKREGEEVASLICHLSRSSREGHLCLKTNGSNIFPTPQEVWGIEAPSTFIQKIYQGIKEVSEDFLNDPSIPLCYHNDCLYFQKNWTLESSFLKNFQQLLSNQPIHPIEINQKLLNESRFSFEQQQALVSAGQHCLIVISGGPGTGKTYLAGMLIKMFGEKRKIALAAPTGKAAANLQNSIQRFSTHTPPAKTLHALLGTNKRYLQKLSADIVLVDESSMIDLKMMTYLFQSIKKGARLILLGDPDQLPPVESGALFHDMIQLLKNSSHIVKLEKCFRTDSKKLITLSHAIKKGDDRAANAIFQKISFGNAQDNIHTIQQHIVNDSLEKFPKFSQLDQAEEALIAFQQFRILSPLNQGPFGVETINRLLFKEMKKKGKANVIPIMIVNNHYSLDLYNGEVGVLVGGDVALFFKTPGKVKKIPEVLLPKYEYAYCLSVHKSQGSEFDEVLLLLPEGSQVFGREMLYTAVTRTKKRLRIWGKEHVLKETIVKNSRRVSGISSRTLRECDKITYPLMVP